MSRYQNAGKNHNLKNNKSFEMAEGCNYLGTNLTKQNSIQEEIKSRLKYGNAYYHSVQNILSSSMLSKTKNIKLHRNISFSVVLCGRETWTITLREESRLGMFEDRKIFGRRSDELTGKRS